MPEPITITVKDARYLLERVNKDYGRYPANVPAPWIALTHTLGDNVPEGATEDTVLGVITVSAPEPESDADAPAAD